MACFEAGSGWDLGFEMKLVLESEFEFESGLDMALSLGQRAHRPRDGFSTAPRLCRHLTPVCTPRSDRPSAHRRPRRSGGSVYQCRADRA